MTPADLIARHKGFTPGPWETDSRIPTRVTGPNDRGICSTGGYQTNTVDAEILNAESEANAALIADAPLMLAALTAQAERIAELVEALALQVAERFDDAEVRRKLEKDAARYRWLRQRLAVSDIHGRPRQFLSPRLPLDQYTPDDDAESYQVEVDKVIDAALAQREGTP